jgi:Family of unknown function (DUF6261)
MKPLQTLSLTRLSVLEFGQHIKSILANIDLLGQDFISDPVLTHYLQTLRNEMVTYDKAMLPIAKSDETAKIAAADKHRDNAVSALTRQLWVYEVSDDDAELAAYQSLSTLFDTYHDLQKWNFEAETNGIDHLLADLLDSKYKPHVELLQMLRYVNRLEAANTAFKNLFIARTEEAVGKQKYDVPAMRKAIKTVYEDMVGYVRTMAKVQTAEQYHKTLDVINAVRKYYHDLLAKRKPGNDDTPDASIPPMA